MGKRREAEDIWSESEPEEYEDTLRQEPSGEGFAEWMGLLSPTILEMAERLEAGDLELDEVDFEGEPEAADLETAAEELDTLDDLDDLSGIPITDTVGLYFRQMGREPLLLHREEIELAKRIELGQMARETLARIDAQLRSTPSSNQVKLDVLRDKRRQWEQALFDAQEAREHLARANTRLVISIAKRYMGQGLPFPDLIQEGNTGLMKAVDKYNYTTGNRFSTYATWWIRQAITRAIAQKTRVVRIPLHMTEKIRAMYRAVQQLEQELGHKPTVAEIAARIEEEEAVVEFMLDSSQHAISLHTPVGKENDTALEDMIADDEALDPAEAAVYQMLKKTVKEVLSELTPRQALILDLRFGLTTGQALTLEEIANTFALSRERIRQLEKEALRRIRNNPKRRKQLEDYLQD